MSGRSVMILVRMMLPGETVRLWFGSGPHIDQDDVLWLGAGELPRDALSGIQYAFAGEASVIDLGLSAVSPQVSDMAYEETQEKDVIGSKVQILLQSCNEWFEPLGSPPKVKFTGEIIDIIFDEVAVDDPVEPHIRYRVILKIGNAFHARRSRRNSVLSDADQQARSRQLNPSLSPDLFCKQITLMGEKTITWPRA